MGQQQRQELGLIAVLSTQPGLQLGTADQELLTAWEISRGAGSVLLFSASPLDSLVLVAHVEKVCIRGNEVVLHLVLKGSRTRQTMRLAYLHANGSPLSLKKS
jgi:hypothetical protein